MTETIPYCGGAAPTAEMMKATKTQHPYAGKTFYVKPGSENDINVKTITSFTTDADGKFSLKLPQGTYSILLPEQLSALNITDYETKTQKVDKGCLEEWWKKPYYLLVVKKKNVTSLNFIFHHRCNLDNDIPCVTYKGPLRP